MEFDLKRLMDSLASMNTQWTFGCKSAFDSPCFCS
jgi:hypothetical protein